MKVATLLLALALTATACTGPVEVREDEPPQVIPDDLLTIVTTSGPPTGNRYFQGVGSAGMEPIVVELEQNASWVVGSPIDEGTLWVVAVESGDLFGFVEQDGVVAPVDLNRSSLPEGTPPVLLVSDSGYLVLAPPSPTGSLLTNPLPLGGGGLAFVTTDEALILSSSTGNRRLDIDPLLDGRLAAQ